MDTSWFDELNRNVVARAGSRRALVKYLAGGALGVALARRSPASTGAAAVVPTGLAARSDAQEVAPAASPTAAGPVKVVTLYGPPTDVAAFERYYAEVHVPLAHRLPGLQRVETARFLGTADGEPAPYHRVAELWFADAAHLQAAAASPAGRALAADVANFATGGVTVLVAQVDAPAAPTAGAPSSVHLT